MNKLFTHAQTRRQTLKKLAAGETLASFSLAGFPLESRYAQAYPADPSPIMNRGPLPLFFGEAPLFLMNANRPMIISQAQSLLKRALHLP